MSKLIVKYLKSYVLYILGALGLIAVQTVIQMVLLMGEMKNILDLGVAHQDMAYIYKSGERMMLYTVLIGVCTIGISYLTSKVSGIFMYRMQRDCYTKILSMTPESFERFGGATLLTRTIDDPNAIVSLVQFMISRVVMVPMVLICILVLIFMNSRSSFWVLFIAIVMASFVMIALEKVAKPSFVSLQEKIDKLNLLVKEKITGVRSIRAFGNEQFEEEKGIQADNAILLAAVKANKPMKFMNPITLVIFNWAVVVIYYLGTVEVKSELASISGLILIFQYLSYFIMALTIIPNLINLLPKAQVSSERVLELLNYTTPFDKCETENKECSFDDGVTIEFQNVSFDYNSGRNVLKDLSFKVEKGQTFAIIGATGSGKSTLLKLIMGFYHINEGKILLNGVSIDEIDKKALLDQVSYAAQKAYVFQETVRNNITGFHENISEENILEACRCACFDEVLKRCEHGLETEMAQGGMNLSGGQRKRLALARAMAKHGKIYLLDDPYAALDAVTEHKVMKLAREKFKGHTVIMVSSKISTVASADQILVLDNGKIVGLGRHDELLSTCDQYKELYDTQCYLDRED